MTHKQQIKKCLFRSLITIIIFKTTPYYSLEDQLEGEWSTFINNKIRFNQKTILIRTQISFILVELPKITKKANPQQFKLNEETNKINSNQSKNYISFQDSRCLICQNIIINVKYVCLFCDQLILCTQCEPNYTYPVIKFKNNFFVSTNEELLYQVHLFQNPEYYYYFLVVLQLVVCLGLFRLLTTS